jgi:glycosyltransferase involved in cell wall biosynthesis
VQGEQINKMKILLLNYEFPPIGGGSSPVAFEIGKRYVSRGHDVHVVTMGFDDLPRKEEVSGMTITRVPCLRRRIEITMLHELASFLFSAKRFLSKHLAVTHYDVNHTHFLLPTGLLAQSIKTSFGLPYIVSAHGSDIPGYNPDRFTFSHRFTRRPLKRIGDDAAKIVVMSEYHASLIRENVHDYSAEHLIQIPNGIDTSSFRPLGKKKIILSTGRLLRRKGFQHLIRAVSDEDCGYELHICGDGPMLNQLRNEAALSRTPVVFHGWVDNQSEFYRDLLGAASIYVLASERENASIALLEAMSAGCATITTGATGCRETVGDAGLLVRAGRPSDLQQSILSIIRDDELRRSLQQRAMDRVHEKFNWDTIVGRYEKELMIAANSHRRRSRGGPAVDKHSTRRTAQRVD